MDEVVEEHREQLKSLSSTTGGPVGSGDAVANVNTNHLGGWHQSSRVIRDSRERKVTLSATTANQLLELQDLIGYDQPSKAGGVANESSCEFHYLVIQNGILHYRET